MSFLDIALRNAARGFRVHPLVPKEKRPLLNDWPEQASGLSTTIQAWAMRYPMANCGVIADSLFCILESDNLTELVKRIGPIPATYTVQARDNRPHFYFLQTPATRTLGNCDLPGVFEFKQHNRYVVSEGSISPHGPEYRIITDGPVMEMPDEIVQKLRALYGERRKKESQPDAGPVAVGGRHEYLTSVAGKLRNSGLDADAILPALESANDARCGGAIPHEDLVHIARSVARYDVPEPPAKVIMGKPAAAVEVDTSQDADELDAPRTRPTYPDKVWEGSFYGEFAELCGADNHIPLKLFSETLRTVVGAIVGRQLSTSVTGAVPRMFTVLIGPPGCGKGTACEYVRLLFDGRWDGLTHTENPLLYGSDCIWNNSGIGARVVDIASAPGLMNAVLGAKGKTPDVVMRWTPMPRFISIREEVQSLFSNFAIEGGTGAGLESILCELYDRTSFSFTQTAKRQGEAPNVMYSLLGGITKELWDSTFAAAQAAESGFLSRVNIIATENKKRVGGMTAPDFTSLRSRLVPFLAALEHTPRFIKPSPDARGLMNEWFADLEMPDGHSSARLNIHAWRTALHIAWLRGAEFIQTSDVESGIKVAEYQKEMRIWHAPIAGDTRAARCEAAIRRTIREAKRMSLRDLKTATNAHRVGIGQWDSALKAMVTAGEIRIEESTGDSFKPLVGGRVKKIVILLKIKG